VTDVPYQPPQLAKSNGIEICYDIFGSADAEPIMLIMGLSAQMVLWDDEFCQQLAQRGFRVIRFDNRDIGQSTKLTGGKRISPLDILKLRFFGILPQSTYTLRDMAQDTTGLMDALGIRSAHVVGVSMGGAIAQEIAIHFPDRIRSLTSIMSTTGNRSLPPAKPEALAVLNDRGPDPLVDFEGYLAHSVKGAFAVGSPGYPPDPEETKLRIRNDFNRSYSPAGFQRQYAAAAASPDRRPKLATIKAPTVVIHGADDPLVPLTGGQDTAASIPGAALVVIPGMGHDFPPPLYDTIVDGIMQAVNRAKVGAA
jgi:pimeloyl-ACP methyl ester carboxylesterase